jgi:hypothetical protein
MSNADQVCPTCGAGVWAERLLPKGTGITPPASAGEAPKPSNSGELESTTEPVNVADSQPLESAEPVVGEDELEALARKYLIHGTARDEFIATLQARETRQRREAVELFAKNVKIRGYKGCTPHSEIDAELNGFRTVNKREG